MDHASFEAEILRQFMRQSPADRANFWENMPHPEGVDPAEVQMMRGVMEAMAAGAAMEAGEDVLGGSYATGPARTPGGRAMQNAVPFAHGTWPQDDDVLLWTKDSVADSPVGDFRDMQAAIVVGSTQSPVAIGELVPMGDGRQEDVGEEVRLDSTTMRRALIASGPSFAHAAAALKFERAVLTKDVRTLKTLLMDPSHPCNERIRMRYGHMSDPDGTSIAHTTPLLWAINGDHTNVFDALVHVTRVDPNKTDHEGTAPLHLACQAPANLYLRDLLKRSDIEVDIKTPDGRTPLLHAARMGETAACRSLLAAGANVEYVAPGGATALIEAKGSNDTQAVLRKALAKAVAARQRAGGQPSTRKGGAVAPKQKREMVCANCGFRGDEARPLVECGACRGPLYCGKACQKADWKSRHKPVCRAAKAAAAAAGV